MPQECAPIVAVCDAGVLGVNDALSPRRLDAAVGIDLREGDLLDREPNMKVASASELIHLPRVVTVDAPQTFRLLRVPVRRVREHRSSDETFVKVLQTVVRLRCTIELVHRVDLDCVFCHPGL